MIPNDSMRHQQEIKKQALALTCRMDYKSFPLIKKIKSEAASL